MADILFSVLATPNRISHPLTRSLSIDSGPSPATTFERGNQYGPLGNIKAGHEVRFMENKSLEESATACLARAHSALVESCHNLFQARTPNEIFDLFLLSAVEALGGSGGALHRRLSGTDYDIVAAAKESGIVPRERWCEGALVRTAVDVRPFGELPSTDDRIG